MNYSRIPKVAKPIDLRSRVALSTRAPAPGSAPGCGSDPTPHTPHPTPDPPDQSARRRELDQAALRYAVVADWFEGLKWSGDPGDDGQNAAYELFTFIEHELREAAKALIGATPGVSAVALRREVLLGARARLDRHRGDGPTHRPPGTPRAIILPPTPAPGGRP